MTVRAKRILLLLTIICASYTAFAQGVSIKIVNRESETPIRDVKVTLIYDEGLFWISNSDGVIKLTKRLLPDDSLVFEHIGFHLLKLAYRDIINSGYLVKMQLKWDDLPPIIFSPQNRETDTRESSAEVIQIASKDILLQNPQTTADLLTIGGKVYVQKSQLGGGSPMIRGMAANRVLIVVDGIRMNNAIFRSGNLQNVISIDPNLVTGTEVLLGPGSVIYGTDAIGGVMSFRIKEPQLSTDKSIEYLGNAMTRLSSANRESTWHVDFEIRSKKISFLSSVTMSNFGDLRMGKYGPEDYLRPEYVEIINGKDSVVANNNPRIQYFSGYSQINLMQKVRWQIKDSLNLNFAVHFGTTSPIPRYDRLIEKKDGQYRDGDWYYGPQNWLLTSAKLTGAKKTLLADQSRLTLAYQNFKESRLTRPFGTPLLTERAENVHMVTANGDLDKKISESTSIYYGAEILHNLVESRAFIQDVFTSEKEAASTRYPDGATWSSASVYAKLNRSIGKKWHVEAGARYGVIQYKADLSNRFFNFPVTSISETVNGRSASLGLVYHAKSIIRLNAGTGFRAPNIDDIGKIFDSEPGKVVVPNAKLQPENVYSLDLSWERNWNNKLLIQANIFYSVLEDAIARGNYTWDGADSLEYEGELRRIQALVNTGSATIYGVQVYFDYKFTSALRINSNLNYTTGETSDGLPMRHVTPLFGSSHLTYRSSKFVHDLYAQYNGEISYKNMAPEEQSKTHIYTTDSDGNPYAPAWWTLNFKTKYTYSDRLSFLSGIENILNKRYRPYSSGITAPGLNFYVSVRARF